jgi:hypothetical protein
MMILLIASILVASIEAIPYADHRKVRYPSVFSKITYLSPSDNDLKVMQEHGF